MISNSILPIDFFPDLTQTSRLKEIHISLFLADATSRISLKAQSHAGAEERFRGEGAGGGVSDEQTIHREISSKGSEWEKRGKAKVRDVCTSVFPCASGVCVWWERSMYSPSIVNPWEHFNSAARVAARKMTEGWKRRDTNLTSFKINYQIQWLFSLIPLLMLFHGFGYYNIQTALCQYYKMTEVLTNALLKRINNTMS